MKTASTTLATALLCLATAALATGCPAPPPPGAEAAPGPVATAISAAPGLRKTCTTSAECGADQRCDFAPGCATPGVCGPARSCTKDLASYCGCDGKTFEGSGSCPDKAFSKRGDCDPAKPTK